MALVLHELSTNAAKYGALVPRRRARSRSRWRLDDRRRLRRSTGARCGGPAVPPPSRSGFGTVLIDRSIPFDLGGEATIEHARDGLRATLRIPAGFITAAGEPTAEPTRGRTEQPKAVAASDLRGKRILLVEDQLLIAMDLEES